MTTAMWGPGAEKNYGKGWGKARVCDVEVFMIGECLYLLVINSLVGRFRRQSDPAYRLPRHYPSSITKLSYDLVPLTSHLCYSHPFSQAGLIILSI